MEVFMKKIFFLVVFFTSIISIAFSQFRWTKDANNPVMSGGGNDSWNKHVFVPCVLYNTDSARYEMWFGASPNNAYPYKVGFATSDDGVNWTPHPSPVLEPDTDSWDESTVLSARVIRKNGQYKMWYSGWSPDNLIGGIGYATSADGINWVKDTQNNPVFLPGSAAWESGGKDWFCILPVESGGYIMWYTAWDAAYIIPGIGYATSADGIIWQSDTLNNPIFTSQTSGGWDYKNFNPHVIMIDGMYHMAYEGAANDTFDPRRMGWATSVDGISWEKYNDPTTTSTFYSESDPVLVGSPGQWDGDFIEPGDMTVEDDLVHLWYSGSLKPVGTNLWRIGHATISLDTLRKYVGIEDDIINTIPIRYSLSQNYPNPFNPTTNIEFSIPKTGFVTLKIYNLLGKEVATLVSKKLTTGTYKQTWDASGFASGIYFYRLETDKGFVQTRKLVLLK